MTTLNRVSATPAIGRFIHYPGTYDGGSRYSEGIGDTVTFEFFGTQLSLLYTGYSNRGNVTVQD